MANYKVVDADRLDADMLSVADTIRTKGGTTDPLAWPDGYKSAVEAIQTGGGAADPVIQPLAITANGTYEAPDGVDGYSPVTVNVAGGATLPVREKEVNFWDYDGTLLYSYTVEEAMALTELPPLPTQPGLICQEWNWTLDEIKEHGRAVEVGATYITDDGKTRIYVNVTEPIVEIHVGLGINGSATVDWGDGTEPSELSGSSLTTRKVASHNYLAPGKYIVGISVTGEASLSGSTTCFIWAGLDGNAIGSYARGFVDKIEVGRGITTLSVSAFRGLTELKSVTLTKDITSIGQNVLTGDRNLEHVNLPRSATNLGSYLFSACVSLKCVALPYAINGYTDNMFDGCTQLRLIAIPNTVKTIGSQMFRYCRSLRSVTIHENVTTISSNAFSDCESLRHVKIQSGTTSMGDNVFGNCSLLTDVALPDGMNEISKKCFYGCSGLTFIQLPDSLISIGESAFEGCNSLISVKIPPNVTNIATRAFYGCAAVILYDFTQHTEVPVLGSTLTFNRIHNDCIFRVPVALYDEWIAATNWSTYADKIVGV